MSRPKVQMLPNKFEIFLQSLREGGQTQSVQNLNISYVFANCQWYYVMTQSTDRAPMEAGRKCQEIFVI